MMFVKGDRVRNLRPGAGTCAGCLIGTVVSVTEATSLYEGGWPFVIPDDGHAVQYWRYAEKIEDSK